MSAKGALGSTLQKFCLEYVLCKTKQKGQVRFFNDIKNFAKRCFCFCIILRLLKGCVYRLKGKTLLLSLLGRSRQRKCECKRCFGSNVAKVLLSIRLVQNKANGASAIFQRHPKFCKTLRLFLYNFAFVEVLRLSPEWQNFA